MNTLPAFTKQQTCRMFGCTMEQLNNQYLRNAQVFEKMYEKAVATSKKVNGYTADQLDQLTGKYYQLAMD